MVKAALTVLVELTIGLASVTAIAPMDSAAPPMSVFRTFAVPMLSAPKSAMVASVVSATKQAPALGIKNAAVVSALRAQLAAMMQTVLANVSVVTADVVKTRHAAKIRSNQTMYSQWPQRYPKALKLLSSAPQSMMVPG